MAMTLKPKPNHPNGKCFATIEEIKEILVSEVFRGLKTKEPWQRIMGVWLWNRNQSPIISMECFATIEEIKEILFSEVFRGLKKQTLA